LSAYFIQFREKVNIMALKLVAKLYDEFWENQNKRLLAHTNFIQKKGNLYDDTFHFCHSNGSAQIDFSVFDLQHIQTFNCAKLVLDGEEYLLSAKDYAKLFFLEAMPKNGIFGLQAIEKMITHIFAFLNYRQAHLADNEVKALEVSDLEDFWISYLVQSVNDSGFYNLISAPNYKGYIKPLSLPKIRNRLLSLGVSGVIGIDITQRIIDVALDKACQSQLSITLNEYKEGGDFNFLGLELGQYYTDYLRAVYQKDYIYTLCCQGAIDKYYCKYDMKNMEARARSTLLRVMQFAFTSARFTPSKNFRNSKGTRTKGIMHQDLFDSLQREAYNIYLENYDAAMSLNERVIDELVIELGLNMRFDAVEIIRILMLQKFHPFEGGKAPEQVWKDYLISLEKTFLDSKKLNINVSLIYDKMQKLIETKKMDEKSFLKGLISFGKKLNERGRQDDYKSFKSELYNPIHAMTNLMVIWLGYRKSEFGFPFNAIHVEPNIDILDNSHVPFRFILKWFVPKTNRGSKINREVTSQCFQIAAQLNNFFKASGDEPCLYKSSTSGNVQQRKTPKKSETFIAERVRANWKNFVNEYQPFLDALRLESLTYQKAILCENLLEEFKRLSHLYNIKSARYYHLLKTAKKVKSDWKRLSCTTLNGTLAQKRFKESVCSYVETGSAKYFEHQSIIDKYLSEKTKKLIASGNVSLDLKAMSDIHSELIQGCKYPSPHAMRHIWAEAVLTRYGGDVGMVVQHQFCHLDSSFFAAYLKGKDARSLFQGARQRYLNSIVELLLFDTERVGHKYLGGFARFVRKATELTKPVSESEIRLLRDSINARVISIQSSHFSVCVPRDGGEQRAKCAKFGDINPQDAKPEFCLNCTNALIIAGNLRGIWSTIQPMIKEALDKNTMGFMLTAHMPTLLSGYKRIKELQPGLQNQEAVMKVLQTIEAAIDSIESKLKAEGIKNG
jgi:hypothetical protein